MLECLCVPGLMVVYMCIPGLTLVCMCLPGLMFVCMCVPSLTIVCMCVLSLMFVCMCDAVRHGRSQTARQQTTAAAAPSPPGSPTLQWGSPPTPSPPETLRLPTSLFQPPLQIPPPPRLVSILHACLLQHRLRPHQCPHNWCSFYFVPIRTYLSWGGEEWIDA